MTYYRGRYLDSYFAERRAELIGPLRLRKPRRDAKETIRQHQARWERAERERLTRSAANRLQRALEGGDDAAGH